VEERTCRIEGSLGRDVRCPGSACPFWVAGAEARQDYCLLDGLDLGGRAALAEWLHELRVGLTGPSGGRSRPGAASTGDATPAVATDDDVLRPGRPAAGDLPGV
jgi:hypothetical protein